jgi:hypothetical protein
VRDRCDYPPADVPQGVAVAATRNLRSLMRAPGWGAKVRVADTLVQKTPQLTKWGTPLSVARDVRERPVHEDRAVPSVCARKAVARIIVIDPLERSISPRRTRVSTRVHQHLKPSSMTWTLQRCGTGGRLLSARLASLVGGSSPCAIQTRSWFAGAPTPTIFVAAGS